MDEAYLGGKEENKRLHKRSYRGRGVAGKQPGVGLLERGGRGKAGSVEHTTKQTRQGEIHSVVPLGSGVCTDEPLSYQELEKRLAIRL